MRIREFLKRDLCDVNCKVTLTTGEVFDFWQDGVQYGDYPRLTGRKGREDLLIPIDTIADIQVMR